MEDNYTVRTLPFNAEAEQSVLGSILVDPNCLTEITDKVTADDFYMPQNKLIYSAIIDLWNSGEAVDSVTISKALGPNIETVGGYQYLANLAMITPTTQNLQAYIKIIQDKAVLRRLIGAAKEIQSISFDENDDVSVILDTSEKYIYDILQNRQLQGFTHIKDVLAGTFEQLEKVCINKGKTSGVATGFSDLDALTNGFQPSDLIIIAARPAMGKTSFALNIAQYAALHKNVPVAVFNLEMSKEQLGNRIIWSEAMINGEKMRNGTLSDDDWPVIASVVGKLSKAPLYIDDSPGITVTDIRAKCRRLQLEKGLGMVVIDYLQLMQGSKRTENRQQEISEISRSLKVLAKELNVPVIALSQLSRATANRTDHKPMLSDLRESGAIEQDADMVIFLHRPDYYDPNTEKKNIAECIIAKHRNGATDTIDLAWNGEFTKFRTLNKTYE
ncbi:MAG: replicative DNA helicase [Clostridia bacterium]|nr:replicative DNA helicase [Clostridia bacterium]MBR2973485.1 replicative DNA helicase [Clostridia bacterium]